MEKSKWLEDLVKKVNDVSTPVDTSLWMGIQAQIVSPTILGMSVVTAKIVGAVASMAVISGVSIAVYSSMDEPKTQSKSAVEVFVDQDKSTDVKEEEETETSIGSVTKSLDNQANIVLVEEIKRAGQQEKALPDDVIQKEEISYSVEIPRAAEPILELRKNEVSTEVLREEELFVEKAETTEKLIESMTESPANEKIEGEILEGKLIDLPNVFTPNSDGINDQFFVQVVGIEDYVLVVLDQKGSTVWKTTNPAEKWDGRSFNGDVLPKGEYVYIITGKDAFGKPVAEYRKLAIQ